MSNLIRISFAVRNTAAIRASRDKSALVRGLSVDGRERALRSAQLWRRFVVERRVVSDCRALFDLARFLTDEKW